MKGGIARIAKTLVDHLCKSHEVILLTNEEGIEKNATKVLNIARKGISPFKIFLNIPKPHNYDLLISADSNFSGIVGGWYQLFHRCKSINLCHGLDCFGWRHNRIMRLIYQRLFSNYNLTLANSLKTSRVARMVGAGKNIRILKPGISSGHIPEKLKPLYGPNELANKKYILSVARLVDRKNFEELIKAFSLIEDKSICLIIIGDGPKYGDLINLIQKLELLDRVQILRNVTDEEIRLIYKYCLLFCLCPLETPTDYEGFGLVYLEANSAGKTVIASNNGGIPDAVVDQQTGLLLDHPSAKTIASTINYLIENDERRQEYERNAISWSKQHDIEIMLEHFDQALNLVIGK